MMFATLDDLEGQVELLVFNSAYAANAEKVDVDKIVIVRGRVDHKEAGRDQARGPGGRGLRADRRGGGRARPSCGGAEPVVRRLTLQVSPGVPESFLEDLSEVVAPPPGRARAAARAWASGAWCSGPTGACPRTAPAEPSWPACTGAARRGRLTQVRPLYTGRVPPVPAPHGERAARVPPVLLVLRPRGAPVRLHRVGLPVPLPLRRRGDRPPLHGLHEQGLPRRDRPWSSSSRPSAPATASAA